MPAAGFEYLMPASERSQTHPLDRAATGNRRLQKHKIVTSSIAATKLVLHATKHMSPLFTYHENNDCITDGKWIYLTPE
jgi:hypothetical protein